MPKEVLLVEDEPIIRMVAADALVDRGIMAWEAGDAAEALNVIEEYPAISLLFTDVDMLGKMDGLELARVVHQRLPHIELIVTSASIHLTDGDLPDQGTFFSKPYPAQRWIATVMMKLGETS